MRNKKGLTAFLSFVVAIIIIIPIIIIVVYVFVFGISSTKGIINSPSAYVTQTASAIIGGTSNVEGSLSPSLTRGEFMSQFYGSPSCISLLDELSRNAALQQPNDPATLSGNYFICFGSYSNPAPGDFWNFLPVYPSNASFPSWFPASPYLNSRNNLNSSGINGSKGTLSFFRGIENVSGALGQSCVSFLNATIPKYGWGIPSAYIHSMKCVIMSSATGSPSTFMSVTPAQCTGSSTGYCPVVFLHGSPSHITLQTCTYSNGGPLNCQFTIS